MLPRFEVSNVTDRKVSASNEMTVVDDNDGEESDSSHSSVNPFDDEEFSEVDRNSDESNDGDIVEDLEREEHGKKLKRGIDKVTSDENDYESQKKKQKTILSKKPPNSEEMIRLRETENLFHSNLFRMQIEEVLLEVKPKKKEKKLVKIWVEKFMKYLLEIPESSAVYSLDDHTWLKDLKVNYPLPQLPVDPKAKFQFIKPTQVKCIGSYNSDCYVGPNYSVDIAVYMPQRFFNKEDYLNCRYHKKRALYLCHIAEYILNSTALDLSTPPQFCLQSGKQLKPVILLKPSAKWGSRVKIYIHALPEMGSFKLSRFNPLQNNVRQKWWFGETVENNETVPTPLYNSSIGHDVVAETNDLLSIKLFQEYPNIKDALILLKIWLHQRELDEGPVGFSGFLLSMLLVYLFKNHKLNPLMSSYQILRSTWLSLCQTDWSTNGLSLAENNSGISIEEFNANYEVVFVDSTGFVNLASNITKLNYLQLKEEAEFAMKYLNNSNLNSFQALFIVHKPFLRQFDHVISINMKKTLHKWKSTVEDDKTKIDLLLDKMQLFISVVGDLLTKGLGQRICQIVVKNSAFRTWSVFTNVPKLLCESVLVGLRLNPETALSVIEKGPEGNSYEGTQFRQFWGSKSELRRFQDGSTCESVVWDTPDAPFARRRIVSQRIVEYLFANVMKLEKNFYKYISNQLESLLKFNSLPNEVDGGIEELSLNVIKSLDGLMKQVRDLSLPLPVASVLGASPVLRFTDVFPPVAYEGYSKCLDNKGLFILKDTVKTSMVVSAQQVDVAIQLGISNKWPENAEAIRRIRAALIIEIGKALSQQSGLRTQPFPDYLIVFKDGYVFRLKVVYPGEIALIKEVTDNGLTAYRDTPQSLKLEKELLHLPKLTGTLRGLSQQYLGYGSTVCLTKRWLRSQMIDDELFPDVVIELLVASQFLSPEPFTAVLQPQMAFLRVLNMLAHTNWCLEPVIVNFDNDLQRDDLTEIEQTFRTGRDNGSLPGLFIATSYDKTGVIWTKDAPSLPILYYIAKLAKESLTILESQLLQLDNDLSKLKIVFRPPLDHYDAVIYLNLLKNTRCLQGIDCKESNKNSEKSCNSEHDIPIIEFNPVQCYLKELRENYGEFALFFHNTYGGNVIGVIFNPTVKQTYDFKVSHINGRKPVLVGKDYKLTFNKEALIEDFNHIGKNLVQKITVNQNT